MQGSGRRVRQLGRFALTTRRWWPHAAALYLAGQFVALARFPSATVLSSFANIVPLALCSAALIAWASRVDFFRHGVARRNGRHTADDGEQDDQHEALKKEMRDGIARGEFAPFYQPIIDLKTGAVAGFECLARWNHPDRGLVMPDEFIPIAETSGLIRKLSMHLLRRACRDAAKWPPHLTLSFNISPIELDGVWLPEQILQSLCASGMAPGRLILEITENRLVGDFEVARSILQSLTQAGVQIALDDFGTGYANMKQLRELKFSRIKIDRGFVQNLQASGNGQIVRSILHLSEGLGLPVTAEGIETAQNAAELTGLGCAFGQGFLFSRPVPAHEALAIANAAAIPYPDTSSLPMKAMPQDASAIAIDQPAARAHS